MGNDDAALAGFEHYLTLDPKDPFVQYQMGEIWLDRGDLSRAESLFRHALEVDPSASSPQRTRSASSRCSEAIPSTAERLISEALAAKPTLRLAHFNLALLAEQRGDVRTAEREYVEELKQHPENFKSAFNLSRLYEQVGDREGQIDALKQSIVSNPRFAEGHLFLAKAYLDSGTNLDEADRGSRGKDSSSRRSRSTRRSDTTCWPISTTGRGAPAKAPRSLRAAARSRRSAKPKLRVEVKSKKGSFALPS